MKRLFPIAAAFAIALTAAPLHAQNFPSKPVTIVVPSGPGSGSDLIARIIKDAGIEPQ